MPEFDIVGRKVGNNYVPVVIVEIGINHEGSLAVAKQMVDAAVGGRFVEGQWLRRLVVQARQQGRALADAGVDRLLHAPRVCRPARGGVRATHGGH